MPSTSALARRPDMLRAWRRFAVLVIWRASLALLLLLGCSLAALGALALPLAALLGWAFLGGFVGVSVWIVVRDLAPSRFGHVSAAPVRTAVVAAAATVELTLEIAGLVALLGAAALSVIVIMLLGTAAWAWTRLRRPPKAVPVVVGQARPGIPAKTVAGRLRRSAQHSPARPQGSPAASPCELRVAELSTQELCLAWRRSYTWLQTVSEGVQREQVGRTRAQLLDELERRDKTGFDRWMASGARAGSDPSRYVGYS